MSSVWVSNITLAVDFQIHMQHDAETSSNGYGKRMEYVAVRYNKNQIYNARKITPKCESEAWIVSHQVKKIQLTFQSLKREIVSFKPLFEGR